MNDTPTTNTINQIAPPRGPIKAVRVCFAKYFDFRGRASRSEFWWLFLFLLLSGMIVETLGMHFHKDAECRATSWLDRSHHCTVLFNCTICGLWYLATLLPFYAVVVRRLRDIGRSGWWVLPVVPTEVVVLIPLADDSIWLYVSLIIWMPLLVMMCFRGKPNAASIRPTEKLRRWFSNRLENRIDRLWLGGVLAVAALTWEVLGMRYIALFLIGYFYVFALVARKKVTAIYPPNGDSIIRFACANDYLSLQTKTKFAAADDYLLPVFCLMFLIYASSTITHALNLSPQTLAAIIVNAGCGWVFLLRHKELFSAYVGDAKLPPHIAKHTRAYFKLVKLFGSLLTIALLWCFILLAYANGWFAPQFFSSSALGDRYAIFAPMATNCLLFHIATLSLLPDGEK